MTGWINCFLSGLSLGLAGILDHGFDRIGQCGFVIIRLGPFRWAVRWATRHRF
ncbi:MAG: hypothetical protein HOM69_00165 [Gammaproteobacteria bacterium]|nr:hypothetical protein [Gammaproteobacteria bacterium]